VTITSKFWIAGGIVGTLAAAIAAVWLTGDPRAFGAVIALVGFVAGVALAREEWRTSPPNQGTDAGHDASPGDNIGRAA
jgi:hypothetical protein